MTKQVILNPGHELSRAAPWSLLTLQTQSHGPVSPAGLFKHLLKLTLPPPFFLCRVNSLKMTLLGTLLNCGHRGNESADKESGVTEEGGRETDRERKKQGITVGVVALLTSSPGLASWRVWLRDGLTKLRAVRASRSYTPPLSSCLNPPKLDYWDPRSTAYFTSTCETLAGLIALNGNAGQIKAGWPVCTLSMPTDGWWKATWASMTGGIVGSLPSGAPIRPRVKCRIPCGNSSRFEELQLSATEDATVQEREEGIRNKGKKQCENDIWKEKSRNTTLISWARSCSDLIQISETFQVRDDDAFRVKGKSLALVAGSARNPYSGDTFGRHPLLAIVSCARL